MSMRKRQPSGGIVSGPASVGGMSGDPVILATGGYDHQIRLWQAHSGICLRNIHHQDSQVNDMEVSPDRQMLAVAGYQHIRMFDMNSNNPNPVINYDGVTKNVSVVGFHDEGKWMFTGGEDNSARIWDLRSRNLQCQKIFHASAPVNTMCLHPNQAVVLIGDQSGVIHIWDLRSDNNEQLVPEPDAAIQCICIDAYGTMVAAVNNKGTCYLWTIPAATAHQSASADEPVQLKQQARFNAHQKYALKCQFSPDATLLATTSADGTVKIWKTADRSLMTELKNKAQRWVWDCAFSGESQYIITASSDSNARLWNVETGEMKREYSGHQKAITCLAFKDDIPPS